MSTLFRRFVLFGVAVLGLVTLIVIARQGGEKAGGLADSADTLQGAALTAGEPAFDFGSLSMEKGIVSRVIPIVNGEKDAVTIEKIYTSCMCTTATLIRGEVRKGPFGMPGHGAVPRIRESLEPGEQAAIEITFDPAAHGPAGVGKIERVVYVEADRGAPLAIRFIATVTP